MTKLSGRTFGKGKLKIEYGSLSKKPTYDKHSRKVRSPLTFEISFDAKFSDNSSHCQFTGRFAGSF